MMNPTHTSQHPTSRHDVVSQRTTGRRHKRMALTLAGIATLILGTASVSSAGAASHNVTYSVTATRSLALSEPSSVAIGNIARTATVTGADGGNLIYSTDATNDKITVSSSAMEANTTLKVTVGSVANCTGTKGTLATMPLTLSATAQDLITSIGPTGTGNCSAPLTYDLTTAGAAVSSNVSKTVTYTIQAA